MAEPVTVNDLADVLRKIIDSNSVDVLGTRALLARYDAQLSEPSKPASEPKQPKVWQYDTEESAAAAARSEPSKPALSEVEQSAVNVVKAYDVVVRLSHRTVRGIEASVECDKATEALRDALKRIGAL